MASDLVIFLLRYGVREPDDVIRVRRVGSSEVRLLYQNGEDQTRATFTTSRDGAFGYLWTLLYTISIDTDPFRYVQLTGIGFPSVMYSISELDPNSPTWTTMITILRSFLYQDWHVIPISNASRLGQSRRTTSVEQNNRSSSVPRSVPMTGSLPSRQEPVNPPQTEWGGVESRTTEPN